jgi:hypothetical protein
MAGAFNLSRYDAAGALLGNVLSISNSTGAATMTGTLTIDPPSGTSASVFLDGEAGTRLGMAAGTTPIMTFYQGGQPRFALEATETHLQLHSYNDDGSWKALPLTIARADGAMGVGSLFLNGHPVPRIASGTVTTEGATAKVVTFPPGLFTGTNPVIVTATPISSNPVAAISPLLWTDPNNSQFSILAVRNDGTAVAWPMHWIAVQQP